MLEKIDQIQGVGLLCDVNGKSLRFHKGTLIYAENGRGKSTLASLMRSVSIGDASLIAERKTIDSSHKPLVHLQFGSGHKVSFSNNAWSESRKELVVFDADFIEKNVHTGGAVSPGHRKNLLEFALGAAAVSAREAEDKATKDAVAANDLLKQLSAQLAGYHPGVLLSDFEKINKIEDADCQIESIQNRIAAAANIASILTRPFPLEVELPQLSIEAFFEILNTTLDDIQEDAEKIVRKHVEKLAINSAETWLSSAQSFDNGMDCPYCGQDTSGVDLIKAYRTHFNAAYGQLKDKVSRLEKGIELRAGEAILDVFESGVASANSIISTWISDFKLESVGFDRCGAAKSLDELKKLLLALAIKKQANPVFFIGDGAELAKAQELWSAVLGFMQESNKQISDAGRALREYTASLKAENKDDLQVQISRLQLSKRRYEPEVIDLFDKFGKAKINADGFDKIKKKARDDLDTLMTNVLGKYEDDINALLAKFGADFRIEKMDANFRGGAPRSEYGLKLRGKSVALQGGAPRFATALSEGDKRTLAFSFFIATTLSDPDLSKRIVVIDDPMCSLDLNRKHHTRVVLKQLYSKVEQLIVLAHDPYFIRDILDDLNSKDGQTQVSVFQLRQAQDGYSVLEKFDVEKECESRYYRHHRMLSEYCETGALDSRSVAKAIRPFLEGYLHRRFPGFIPQGLMFGQVLSYANEMTLPHPVAYLHPLIEELQEINDYAGKFHHDTNPGNADTVQVNSTELKTFCQRSLQIVHSGSAS